MKRSKLVFALKRKGIFRAGTIGLLLTISAATGFGHGHTMAEAIRHLPVLPGLLTPGNGPNHAVLVRNAADIAAAMKTAKPGDTLKMQDGDWKNQHILFSGTGTATAPIVLVATTPGKVVLSGSASLHMSGTYLEVSGLVFKDGFSQGDVIEFRNGRQEASNCRLTHTVIENYNPPDLLDTMDNKWVSLYGQHNRIDHCSLQGKRNQGTTLVVWLDGRPAYHRIDHNYFGPRPPLGRNGGETIRIGTSTWSQTDACTTVENNYFDRCDGEIEVISNKSGHNLYRNNTFYECQGTLTLRHGNYARVENNVFIGGGVKGTGGVRVIGSHHKVTGNRFVQLTGTGLMAPISVMNAQQHPELSGYWAVDSFLIADNHIIECRQGIVIGSGAGQKGRTVTPSHGQITDNFILSKAQPIVLPARADDLQLKDNIIL